MVALLGCMTCLAVLISGGGAFRARSGKGAPAHTPSESTVDDEPLQQVVKQLESVVPERPAEEESAPRVAKPHPLILAHRGDSIAAPENTLEAFRSAQEKGADVIECDVLLSADGVVVVFHDDTVDRTTEAQGSLSSYTYEVLSRLDAGYRFTQDGGATYPFRGQGVRIPALRDVLLAMPDMIFNIDMKQGEPMARPLAALIEELGCQDRVQVATTKLTGSGLDTFRELQPTVKLVASIPETIKFIGLFAIGLASWHKPVGFAYMVPAISWITDGARMVRAANSLGQAVQHWTVNDRETMVHLLDVGSDGIITDDVGLAAEVFAPYRPPPSAP